MEEEEELKKKWKRKNLRRSERLNTNGSRRVRFTVRVRCMDLSKLCHVMGELQCTAIWAGCWDMTLEQPSSNSQEAVEELSGPKLQSVLAKNLCLWPLHISSGSALTVFNDLQRFRVICVNYRQSPLQSCSIRKSSKCYVPSVPLTPYIKWNMQQHWACP